MLRYLALVFCLFSLPLWNGRLAAQTDFAVSTAIRIGDTTQLHVLHLTSGDRLLGHVLGIDSAAVRFRFRRATTSNRFERARVRYIGLPGEAPPRQAMELPDSSYNRQGRYLVNVKEPYENLFYFRSALPTPTSYSYRNLMVALNEFNFRLTKNLDLGGLALVPVVLGVRLRYHTRIAENLHVGLVNDNYFVFTAFPAGASLIYPTVTFGAPSQYLNYGVGYVFSYDDFEQSLSPFFNLGGSLQFAPRWRVMGNIFYFLDEFNDNVAIPQVMFSHNRFRHRYDFGIIPIFDDLLPFLPAFGYSLYF
jgi:hypothetical protein